MTKKIIFMFSGQGSQYFQMAKQLYINNYLFRESMVRLDNVVFFQSGQSILEYLLDSPKNQVFDRLQYTHPAIFMVQYALAQVLMQAGVRPDLVLGSSLGEFVSASVAGALSPEDAISTVLKQAELVEKCCPIGGMIAILHDRELYGQSQVLSRETELAAVNYESHFVVSLAKDKIHQVEHYLKSNKILHQVLPVNFPFHSSLMDPLGSVFCDYLKSLRFNTPNIPLISCLTGEYLKYIAQDYFWQVAREPMDVSKTFRALEGQGDYIYIDLGPGGTMAGFAKKNFREHSRSESHGIITPFETEMQNLDKLYDLMQKRHKKSLERMNGKMVTFMFPGQGSQYRGMGGSLFELFPDLVEKADEVLGYSIKELCLNNPDRKLNQTQYTQPAMYVVNVLTYLSELKNKKIRPDFVIGHSLGEYSALYAAGVFDFETGLKLVKKRGELMSQISGGGMAAVLGLNSSQVQQVLTEHNLTSLEIANFNTPTQIVLAGPREDILSSHTFFEAAGAKYIPLNVSGAFHSSHMQSTRDQFKTFIEQFQFTPPQIPVISNVYAKPYKSEQLKETLLEQISSPVRWTETIQYLLQKGQMEFVEIGPGEVLTKMAQAIGNDSSRSAPAVAKIQEKADKISEKPAKKSKPRKAVQKDTQKETFLISASTLGDDAFKKEYNLKYAYVAGSMYRGISSKEMVVRLGKNGMLGFLGTGGMPLNEIEDAVRFIKEQLGEERSYGLNLLHNPFEPDAEEKMVDLLLKHGVSIIEASAFLSITPALVKYRAKGLRLIKEGQVAAGNRIFAKVSRPEIAEAFLSPAPQRIVDKLRQENSISAEQAELLAQISMADEICVEADSGGHTDQGNAYALIPTMIRLRDNMIKKYQYANRIRVGAAGGIGTPEAAVAAFMLGADFVLTGSINQCTIEAATSERVKDLLQQMNVQDTDYAPAGDMFEMGAKVQALKRGVFFPARANKLYDLYKNHNSLEELDQNSKQQIQERFFKRSFAEVYREVQAYFSQEEIRKAEGNPKHKMALIFKWYFGYSTQLALKGTPGEEVNYQILCGPALGAFNQWVKGTELEPWRNRHVDEIGEKLMTETAALLNERVQQLISN